MAIERDKVFADMIEYMHARRVARERGNAAGLERANKGVDRCFALLYEPRAEPLDTALSSGNTEA